MRESPELKKAFQKEHAVLCLARAKVTLALGIVIFPAFAGLDYFFAPELFGPFLRLRLLTAAEGLLFLAFLALRPRAGLKFANSLTVFYGASIQFVISYMCLRLGGFNSPYYTGLIVVILGIGLLMPWHPFYMIALNLFTGAGYLSQFFFVGMNSPVKIFVNSQFFLICSFVLTSIGAAFQYRIHFHLRRQKMAVQELSDLKSQLMSIVSHDLRGPLAVIRDSMRLLDRKSGGRLSDDQRELLALGERNVARMLLLVNDLLDFGRIEAGKIELQKKMFSLNEIVQNVLDLLGQLASQKEIEILAVPTPRPVFLKVDPARISQVFDNLLRNALQHTPKGGKITIRIEDGAEEALCSVTDTGAGIPPERTPELFEQFRKFGDSGGLGLGLFISRKFVEMHGGRIRVESSPGQGATFSFTLPRTDA